MVKLVKQHTVSTGTQVAVSCQSCGYRQHLKPSELTDPSRVVCAGPDCTETFSVKEGIKNAIASDNDFMAWCFISDTMVTGQDTVFVGIAKIIVLEKPVKTVKKVFLSPVEPLSVEGPVYLKHAFILPDTLIITSSGDEAALGKPIEVDWTVYANYENAGGEAWREYLQKAKESLINEDYQDAIVEAEIAVEVTLEAVLWELLIKRKKLTDDVAEWVLNNVRGVSDRAKHVMDLAIGKKISDINPIVYKNWVHSVAKKRNRIVHQGEQVTKEEAVTAIGAAFELIWLLLELVNRNPIRV